MLYAILAYHVEDVVYAWTSEEDAQLMANLLATHERWEAQGRLGPAARLGPTERAVTLRGPGEGVVIDGPFAETKEQLLGLYVVDCADQADAIASARELRRSNPTAVYEVRPIRFYTPGAPFPRTDADANVNG